MLVCVCVCNHTPLIEATNRGEMLLSDLQQASFSSSLCLPALSVQHTCLHFAPLIPFFFPQQSFHLFTCLHASACLSVYHRGPVSNKLVCSPESLSSHSALITVSVSVIFSVCQTDRWRVCFSVCVCMRV